MIETRREILRPCYALVVKAGCSAKYGLAGDSCAVCFLVQLIFYFNGYNKKENPPCKQ